MVGYSLADGRVLGSWRLFAAGARGQFVGVADGFAAYVLKERLYVVRLPTVGVASFRFRLAGM